MRSDYSVNSSSNPVASGAVLVVYLSGQGPVDNAVPMETPRPTSPLSTATATATATIGGMDATVQFLGLTPGFTGLAQANILVPTLATADYPLVITVGGYRQRVGHGLGFRFRNGRRRLSHAGGAS